MEYFSKISRNKDIYYPDYAKSVEFRKLIPSRAT